LTKTRERFRVFVTGKVPLRLYFFADSCCTGEKMKTAKRVFFVEDNLLLRNSVKKAIESSEEFLYVGEHDSVEGLMGKLSQTRPDVILLDLKLRESYGLDAIAEIKKNYPKVKIVIYTMLDDMNVFLECIKRGADGYLLKSATPAMLCNGLMHVLEDRFITSPEIKTAIPKAS